MPVAKAELSNYLTETIRRVVRREVLDSTARQDKLFAEPRIWNDLLSSQPMCFNLFAELAEDVEFASRVLRRMTVGRVDRVTAVQFEHSPGRRAPRYTGDRSAFDVFVDCVTRTNERAFVGIEIKYHEGLGDEPAPHRDRYDEIALAMKCFDATAFERLRQKPIQQVWRDHLLAGSLLLDQERGYSDGFFVFLYPKDNANCAHAVDMYSACLTARTSFAPWTLETLVEAMKVEGGGPWVGAFESRYLAFERIDRSMSPTG
jgi:hypothetical protein